jgi:hypothetical protein
MKTKRQKHKAAKARSIAASAAKKLEIEAGSESETDDVAQTAEPPKKKPKLVKQHPLSTKQKSDDRPDGNEPKRQRESLKEPQSTDTKTSAKSKPVEKRKKRKEVTIWFVRPPLQQSTSDTDSFSVEVLKTAASTHIGCSGWPLRLLLRLRSTTCPTI